MPTPLTDAQFYDLVAFVRDGLMDPNANAQSLCKLIPRTVPSGRTVQRFEGCN